MLKKISLFLAVCLLVGCGGGKKAPTPGPSPAVSLETLVDDALQEYPLPMPAALEDGLVENLLGLPPEDVADYYGYLSLQEDCPGQLVGVHATPGRGEAVAQKLEARRAFVAESCTLGTPEQRNYAAAGGVVFWGDYVFLMIPGTPDSDPVKQVAAMTKKIEASFQK